MDWRKVGIQTTIGLLTGFLLSLSHPVLAQSADPLRSAYQQMLNDFDKNLAEARQSPNRWQVVDVLNGAGIAYRYFGNYEKSAEVLQQALTIAREIKDYGRESMVLRELASTYSKLGDYLGIKFYEKQRQMMQSGSPESRGAILFNLGLAYMQIGEYLKTAEALEAYLPIVRQLKDPIQEDIALGILGSTYRLLGESQKSTVIQQQRLVLARQTRNVPTELQVLLELAGIEQYTNKNYQKALELYQQLLQLAQRTQQPEWEAIVLQYVAILQTQLNNPKAAVKALEQQLALARRLDNQIYIGFALDGLSRLAALQGNLEQAIDWEQQAVAALQKFNQLNAFQQNWTEAQYLGNLGILQFRANRLSEAETNLQKALKLFQGQQAQALGNANLLAISRDDLNLNLKEQQADLYRALQQVYIAQKRIETALEVSEAGRARAFVELLANRSNPIQRRAIDEKAAQVAPITMPQMKQVAQDHQATLVQYSIVYDDIRSSPYRLGGKQAREAAVLIWVIRPDGTVSFRQVALSGQLGTISGQVSKIKASLSELIVSTRASIGAGNRGFSFNENSELVKEAMASTDLKTPNEGLRQLYDILIQPIADQLPQEPGARVVFVPQDDLFLVPFAALQDASGKYLVEQHTIVTAPAIQILQLTQGRRQPKSSISQVKQQDVLVVGNPVMPKVRFNLGPPQQLASLPGAEQEAQAIAVLFQTQPLIGNQATETAVVARMQQAQMIHLATHGLLDSFLGFQSSLALTPVGQEDGLLTARELLNLKLKAELVVLSACDTGRGRIIGDGVVGLSRSLLSAGAATVVVSLWKVPDAPTAFLMTEFYRNLQRGATKAEALRQAMLKTRQEYPNPLDWAAFTLMGEAE